MKSIYATLLITTLFFAQTSSAFVYVGDSKKRYPDDAVTFYVNLPGYSSNGNGIPLAVGFERALNEWDSHTTVLISMSLEEKDSCDLDDTFSAVSFVDPPRCGTFIIGGRQRAFAIIQSSPNDPYDGVNSTTYSSDISFIKDYPWNVKSGTILSENPFGLDDSLVISARHELGHALGLDHSIFYRSVMGKGNYQGLSEDDICGVNILYDNPESCSLLLSIATLSGEPTTALFTGGASADRGYTYKTLFTATESISIFATIVAEDQHVKTQGQTYIVIQRDDGSFLAKDNTGSFVSWDGSLETLPAYEEKILQPANEVIVIDQFVPASIGVSNQSLKIFTAYTTATNPDELYYSSEPIVITIE